MSSKDYLNLAQDANTKKKLLQQNNEEVMFSDLVIKVNRKGKEQNRALLVTDKCLYNLDPKKFGSVIKRRIFIDKITAITVYQPKGAESPVEFAVHIPDEYDYQFQSSRTQEIVDVLQSAYALILKGKADASNLPKRINVMNSSTRQEMKDQIIDRVTSGTLSREDIMRRRKNLEAHESDKEETGVTGATKAGGVDEMEIRAGVKSEKVGLDDFEFLKVLGRGGFGKVMLVRKKTGKDSDTVYAMKILKKAAIIQRNQVEHTQAERKILESLQHPFLMTLRYAFQSKQKLYFVLDYYTGGELFFHLKKKRRFDEKTSRLYIAEIALALGHLHSLGVIYRDIKPENILLDKNGHLCLTDFGLAKELSADAKTNTFGGTPEYLAPEVVAGQGHDRNVDWWSLGILLYELVVGLPPFYSQNIKEMYHRITAGVLRFPPSLSKECKSFIIGLLNRDPTKRLGAATDVEEVKAHPFFASLDWDTVMAKGYKPGYVPKTEGLGINNFDTEFTSEPVVDSVVPVSALASAGDQNAFGGFTFVPGKGGGLG
jgi:serum/glucocorticoid-regulated kinase 2